MSLIDWQEVNKQNSDNTIDGTVGTEGGRKHVLAKRPDKLQLVLDRLRDNDSFHFVSDGSWSMHDFLLGVIDDYPGATIYLTTYAITETSARILCELLEQRKIRELYILGDYRIKDRYPAVEQLLNQNATIRGTQIHGKVMLIDSSPNLLTMVGSANWTTNPRIEVGVIDKSWDTFSFHKDWIETKINNGDVFDE